VEELYFFRRYAEAAEFLDIICCGKDGEGVVDGDTMDMLRRYKIKVAGKLDCLSRKEGTNYTMR
jgi:hypothetical protein